MTAIHASRTGIRSIWRAFTPATRTSCPSQRISQCQRHQSTSSLLNKAAPHLPRILQPSMWENVIPPAVRENTRALFRDRRKKPTNPATYFIWIYLLIGSQAIRILQVKNDYTAYSRKAELQLQKLREVVQKLQAGEEVDVEKVLGTGVPEEEEAWDEAMREIQEEERVWTESKRKKREERERERLDQERQDKEKEDASPVSLMTDDQLTAKVTPASSPPLTAPGFY